MKIKVVKNKNLIKTLTDRLENIKNKNLNQNKPKVACVEWIDPLMAAGNWIPEMTNIAGGEDILGKIGVDSHWIKFEDIQSQAGPLLSDEIIKTLSINSILKSSFFIPGTARSISKESLFSIELTDGTE